MELAAQIRLVTVIGCLAPALLCLPARAAEEHPLKNAKVGEWVEFVSHTEAMGQKMEMQMKQSVVAKDATSVTLRNEMTMMGTKMPGKDIKVPLDKPYEPYAHDLTNAKITPLGDGDETITVEGKAYPCHWTKVKVVATQPQAVEMTSTVWTCKDVPVSGMVRMQSSGTMGMAGQGMTMKASLELTGASSR